MGNTRYLINKIAILGLTAWLICGGLIAWLGLQDRIIKADVAVVLGNRVDANGQPAPRLAARLDKSFELFQAGQIKTIIVSGGTGRSRIDEATAMAAYLKAKGVPGSAIVIDSNGVNTWNTALFTSNYLKTHKQQSVIVISQYFHVPRAVFALKAAGCHQVGQAAPRYLEMEDLYSTSREIAALVAYWLKY